MKRTRIPTLALLLVLGGVSGAFLETALASGGRPIINPPVTLPVALVAIGVLVVALAVPIRRLTKGRSRAPVDPLYATRVVMLAKASALTGSLLLGGGAGILIYLLSRTGVPAVGSVAPAIALIVGSGILLAAGLIAEYMCTIPPEDPDDDDQGKKPVRVRS
jgi:hypothetical protein